MLYVKDVQVCSVDIGKAYSRILRKNVGKCCWSIALAAVCSCPLSHCIPVQMFVPVSTELNHDPSAWMLDSDVCCHHSSSLSI